MQIRRYFLLVAAMIAMPMAMVAQDADIEDVEIEIHKTTKKADEYFESKEYSTAVEVYAKAYSKEKSREQKQRISYNMAECYRNTGQFKRAASYYLRAQKLGYGALAGLGYAEMLQSQGEYEDAIVAYEEYKKLIPSDPRAEEGIQACRQAATWVESGSLFSLDNAKDLNSKKSDYAIAYAGKRGKEDLTLMVSSMRDNSTGKKKTAGQASVFLTSM